MSNGTPLNTEYIIVDSVAIFGNIITIIGATIIRMYLSSKSPGMQTIYDQSMKFSLDCFIFMTSNTIMNLVLFLFGPFEKSTSSMFATLSYFIILLCFSSLIVTQVIRWIFINYSFILEMYPEEKLLHKIRKYVFIFTVIITLLEVNIFVDIGDTFVSVVLNHAQDTPTPPESPVLVRFVFVANILMAIIIQFNVRTSQFDSNEYSLKPYLAMLFISLSNVFFISLSVLFLTVKEEQIKEMLYHNYVMCFSLDLFIFTYIYVNLPKRKFAKKLLKNMFICDDYYVVSI